MKLEIQFGKLNKLFYCRRDEIPIFFITDTSLKKVTEKAVEMLELYYNFVDEKIPEYEFIENSKQLVLIQVSK